MNSKYYQSLRKDLPETPKQSAKSRLSIYDFTKQDGTYSNEHLQKEVRKEHKTEPNSYYVKDGRNPNGPFYGNEETGETGFYGPYIRKGLLGGNCGKLSKIFRTTYAPHYHFDTCFFDPRLMS